MKYKHKPALLWAIIVIIAVLTAAIAANSQTPPNIKTGSMSSKNETKIEQENRKIVFFNFDKINRGDIAGSVEDWSEDLSNHGTKVGRDGVKMILGDIIRTFPDAQFEVKNLVAQGDTVVVQALFKGTHRGKGELPVNGGLLVGVEPTGKSFAVQHIHWFRLRDKKIIEHYASRDDIEMMQQLGLSLQVGSTQLIQKK